MNMTRQLSDSKTRKRIYMQKPQIIDVEASQSDRSTMAPVAEQVDTLEAIIAYNKALKPARRAKDSLPEIRTTNVIARDRYVKDYKKQKMGVERHYH